MLDKVSGASLSTTAVWNIVLHYAHQVGIAALGTPRFKKDVRETVPELRSGILNKYNFCWDTPRSRPRKNTSEASKTL